MPFPGMPMPNMPLPGPMSGPPGQSPPGANPLSDLAMSSLDKIQGGQKPGEVFARVDEALSLAHKLIMSVLPQITNVNPTVAKDLHQISQRVLDVKGNVQKESPVGEVPEELMALLNSGDELSQGSGPKPIAGQSPFQGGM